MMCNLLLRVVYYVIVRFPRKAGGNGLLREREIVSSGKAVVSRRDDPCTSTRKKWIDPPSSVRIRLRLCAYLNRRQR